MMQQRTLKNTVRTTGVGLHSGRKVVMTLRPAPPGSGIVFRRSDLPGTPDIPALAHHVSETTLGTSLTLGESRVCTVEHLLSAVAGLGIDNLCIELSAPEVPIMDGSAAPFVFLMQSVGVVEQAAPKAFLKVLRPIEVRDGDKWARFEPGPGFSIQFEIEFDHPVFRRHSRTATMEFSTGSFLQEISRARTFGFMRDLEAMRANNLGLGGTLENAIVLDEYGILNEDGLRFEDEFVKHKVLDAIADLYLLGHCLIGRFSANKSGHGLNNQVCRALLDQPDAWELVSFAEATDSPIAYDEALAAAG
ncbi:MAG: UDP-3-O-acyl-N-acetylglucosamine deacetylase [Steroidobacteraceae bacterium]